MDADKLANLPDELKTMSFTIIKSLPSNVVRLGQLTVRNRVFKTPSFVGNTSRGTIPHLSQDNYQQHTNIHDIYVPLEDFIEKGSRQIPPVYKTNPTNNGSALKSFIALPNNDVVIMGARRTPAIPCPGGNTNTTISILTSVGFRVLSSADYAEAALKLQPDILIGLGDIVYPLQEERSLKRIDRMGERTLRWMRELIELQNSAGASPINLFAPILPVDVELQRDWLDSLIEPEVADNVSGLAIYSAESVLELPPTLSHLPRLALTEPQTPSKILQEISLGMDLLTIPFISGASEAGIALDFCLHSPQPLEGTLRSLGFDMWDPRHATDMNPLSEDCSCYACQNHHRAYIHHLLSAKEMLAWVLLQIHNHDVLDRFFADIRQTILDGTFEHATAEFDRVYENKLPEQTGQGPRLRGYQFKSEGPGEAKRNARSYNKLDDVKEKLEETTLTPSPGLDGDDLERTGFAEKAD